MNNIIVTGGSGYIGSHIVNLFAKNGYNVFSLDKEPWEGILHHGINPYIVNLQNYNEIVNVFKEIDKIDCIIHCAGELGINRSYEKKDLFYKQNVFVTDCMLDIAVQFNVKNFIFASSASVYADSNHPVSTNNRISDSPSPYSQSKLICEEKLKRVTEYADLNYLIFRYFNVVGCDTNEIVLFNKYLHKPQLFPRLIQTYVHNSVLQINGNHYSTSDGTCIRDYINVLDLAKLHFLAYKQMVSDKWSQQFNGIYNAGTGHGWSVMEIIDLCKQIMQRPVKIAIAKERRGDSQYLCANIESTKRIFNWEPTLSAKDTLASLFLKVYS